MIIDTHCHLDVIEDEHQLAAAEIIANAKANGVLVLQTICVEVSKFARLLAYTQQFPEVFCSVGIHPCNIATEAKLNVEELLAYAQHPKVTGIGETGLDYYFPDYIASAQRENFVTHINAARIAQLPLIIHSRAADADMMDILEVEMKNGEFPALLHCFASGKQLAYKALDLGMMVSFSGIVTFKNALEIQEVAKAVPVDRILVETDAPFLAPVPYRGKMNQPAYTRNTLEFLAELREVPIEQLSLSTVQNTMQMFSRMTNTIRGLLEQELKANSI